MRIGRKMGTMKTTIQEGLHTVTVYFPSRVVTEAVGRDVDGITFVFSMNDLKFETVFTVESQLNPIELGALRDEAYNLLITHYEGEEPNETG